MFGGRILIHAVPNCCQPVLASTIPQAKFEYCRIAELEIPFGVVKISLKIPAELVARMDAVACAKRTSRSALLRQALEEKLEISASKSPPSLYDRSADLCGKQSSGVGDLASNPKHLEGFGS